MKQFFLLGVFVVLAVFAMDGCIFDPDKDPPGTGDGDYKPLTSPENVMNNLVVSYRRREIQKYAEFLDKEFIFRFQDGDEPPELGREFWTHDEDSTGTEALFNSPSVSDISVDLTYGAAEEAEELGMEGTMKIRVTPMKLTVDDVDGTTFLVEGDIQDMFFRNGEGADSTSWTLIEWRDSPGAGGVGAPGVHTLAEDGNVVHVSWGELLGLRR